MSKDMLGPTIRALVGVPRAYLPLIADIANRLTDDRKGTDWHTLLKQQLRDGLPSDAKVAVSMPKLSHIIDCDASPFVPDDCTVKEHQKGGQLVFDPSKVEFYLSDGQKNGKSIVGNKLRKELANKPVMNANELDFLLANPDLIPEDWKKDATGKIRDTFFWGTVYRQRYDGRLFVRYLYWDGGRWHWRRHWLDCGWSGYSPAALRAN